MPKRTADDYAADGGFVVDGNSDDDNDNDAAMDSDEEVATSKSKKSKKQKTASASASAPAGKAAASKSGNGDGGIPGGGAVGKDGAEYWEVRPPSLPLTLTFPFPERATTATHPFSKSRVYTAIVPI